MDIWAYMDYKKSINAMIFFYDEETFQVSWFELLCIHEIYFKSHFYLAMNSQQVNRDTLHVTVTQRNSSGH